MAKLILRKGENVILKARYGNFLTILASTIFIPFTLYAYFENKYVITNKRIKVFKGIISTSERDLMLSNLRRVHTKRDFFNRLVRIMTLGIFPEQGDVILTDMAGTEFVLGGVVNPKKVRDEVYILMSFGDHTKPNEPENDEGSFAQDGGYSGAEPDMIGADDVIDAHDTVAPAQPAPDAVKSAAERAFDLFDAGKIGEAGLLAALGVSRDGYVPTEIIAHRALDAVEAGRLSEAALTRVLGG